MSQKQTNAQFKRFSKTLNSRREKWLTESKTVHNNLYDYSKVVYTTQLNKVEIICQEHGSFFQTPSDHKNNKHGCPKCSHNFPLSNANFLKQSRAKFNDKFILISKFNGTKHPVTLSCNEHGEFTLSKAEGHLKGDGGCPGCWYETRLDNLKPGNISKAETKWLDSLGIPLRQHTITINNTTFLVDGFDPASNTIYEYYGGYWHGDPTSYAPNDYNTKLNKTFGALYQKTILREDLLKTQYNLITKWAI